MDEKLRIAFIHPDLGIGGAERLVVDAALGLQNLGHSVDIYTSHHDTKHCFEETRDGTLHIHHIKPPFPRAYKAKLHIFFAHLRQLHLTSYLLRSGEAETYDVFFVDQLSTCVPLLRMFARRRVVFYCHFPDKLLADGELQLDGDGKIGRRRRKGGILKRVYRMPMDWLEEITTGNADILLANSEFTSNVFNTFFSIPRKPRVVYPGINLAAYAPPSKTNSDSSPEIQEISSNRPTLLSLNRFEKKKNAALALKAFALLKQDMPANTFSEEPLRLVLAGGYDPRLQDNIETLQELLSLATSSNLTYHLSTPTTSLLHTLPSPTSPTIQNADILFLLNFTTPQRAALLTSPSTLVLLYTPANEHFGIGPVEGMACGLPVLACDSGGPTESVLTSPPAPPETHTGWLCPPSPQTWAHTLQHSILPLSLNPLTRAELAERAKARAHDLFGMEAMALAIQEALYDAVQLDGGVVENNASAWFSDVLLAMVISLVAYAIFRFVVCR